MTALSPGLTKLLPALSANEQSELERFAMYLLLRRKISAEQILTDDISTPELAQWVTRGGGFDWLAAEPDLYSESDGEAVVWPDKA
ncbi:hypothetical protein HUU05_03740 [candidate division KSB1 bacterium]|nr:hypothetical protein [candidate division KSB1 bacterium]